VILRAYGRTVGLDVPESVRQHLLDRLPPTYRLVDAEPERVWSLDSDDLEQAGWLLSDLELWVAEHARRCVFVHAGCAVWQGRAIVLPGRTLSGKSSLTAALVKAGATYYSDEYVVLDPRGQVRPYARALSIRPYAGGPATRVPVEEIGGKAGRGPVPVGLVAHLQYGGDEPGIESVSRGRSVLHLVDNAIAAQSRPQAVMTALVAAVETALTVAGTRADADDAARRLLELLTTRSGVGPVTHAG
jgi:hypothetical protein